MAGDWKRNLIGGVGYGDGSMKSRRTAPELPAGFPHHISRKKGILSFLSKKTYPNLFISPLLGFSLVLPRLIALKNFYVKTFFRRA
ncbi:hypothetical protein ACDQ55_15070 [Chitinophaga sp. 30R24]|uniref:hypothetical protein n=1 Tax=Chitinophaga sp. 30R24 TaxID=3248838 RepID=UPI003B90F8EF